MKHVGEFCCDVYQKYKEFKIFMHRPARIKFIWYVLLWIALGLSSCIESHAQGKAASLLSLQDLGKQGFKLYNTTSVTDNSYILQFVRHHGDDSPWDEFALYYSSKTQLTHIPVSYVRELQSGSDEAGFPYENIMLSPDRMWFTASQKVVSHESSGYLFQFIDGTYRPCTINSDGFDNAAWKACCRLKHVPESSVDDVRMINFDHWTKDVLHFHLVGKRTSGSRLNWHCKFNVLSRRFEVE